MSRDNVDNCLNEKEIEAADLNYDEVKKIVKGLSKYSTLANKLGIEVFGASGSGQLRFYDGGQGPLILASIPGGCFDGGDGGIRICENGFLRGE